jgi:hypothetical protein
MLAGLMSRCSTPSSCAAARPVHNCRAISIDLSSGSNATRERSEVLAVDVLHRQEVAIIDLTDVEDAAHVRVRHAE